MWGPPLPLCLLGWPPCLPCPWGSPPFPFQKSCVHCPRKVIFLRRMVLFEAFNGVGGVVVSLGGGYAFPLTAPVRGVGVGADQQRDVQLLGRVSDGEDNLGEIKVGGSASWSQTLEGCSEQSWQCRRREARAGSSHKPGHGTQTPGGSSFCSFGHGQLPCPPRSPAPCILYLHKGIEAGVALALPVCRCLKVQLVGAGFCLPPSQEGQAAPILIRPPEIGRSKPCRAGWP